MADYKTVPHKLHQNLNILRKREAKYLDNVPLDLLNTWQLLQLAS